MRKNRKKNKTDVFLGLSDTTPNLNDFTKEIEAYDMDFMEDLNLSMEPFSNEILDLRQSVLHPQGSPDKVTYLRDKDPFSAHIVIRKNQEVIAVGSLLPEDESEQQSLSAWRIRGMAVRSDMQGFGLGTHILNEMWEYLKTVDSKSKVKPTLVWCNARVEALNLYKRFGFEVLDGVFTIPGSGLHQRLKYKIYS